jgi:hypothetical protein
MNKKSQRGNVLFLILIAVALFAALSYAVTQSTRGGGDANREKAELKAAQILQWHAVLKSETLRFSLRSGIAAGDIRITGGNSWTACTSGTDCLWAPEGGGVEYPPPQINQFTSGWTDSVYDGFAGGSSVNGFTDPHWFEVYMGGGAEREAICQAYNDLQNIGPIGTTQNSYPGEETACYLFSGSSYTIYFVYQSD